MLFRSETMMVEGTDPFSCHHVKYCIKRLRDKTPPSENKTHLSPPLTLIVSNLPRHYTSDHLKKMCNSYKTVYVCAVERQLDDHKSKQMGYGFVRFRHKQEALHFMALNQNLRLENKRTLVLKVADNQDFVPEKALFI